MSVGTTLNVDQRQRCHYVYKPMATCTLLVGTCTCKLASCSARDRSCDLIQWRCTRRPTCTCVCHSVCTLFDRVHLRCCSAWAAARTGHEAGHISILCVQCTCMWKEKFTVGSQKTVGRVTRNKVFFQCGLRESFIHNTVQIGFVLYCCIILDLFVNWLAQQNMTWSQFLLEE